MSAWQSIETAPKGLPTENIGCSGAGEWFEGRVAVKFGRGNPDHCIVIQRRAWPQEDRWRDRDDTHYAPDYFDAWRDLQSASSSQPARAGDEQWLTKPDG